MMTLILFGAILYVVYEGYLLKERIDLLENDINWLKYDKPKTV